MPSTRESSEKKAARYLGERRFDVRYSNCDPKRGPVGISAIVRGDSGTYKTKWQRARGGTLVGECTCADPRSNCWHLKGLKMIWTGEQR